MADEEREMKSMLERTDIWKKGLKLNVGKTKVRRFKIQGGGEKVG